MFLINLTELCFRYYSAGNPDASKLTIRKQDIEQYIKIKFADLMRQRYYESKQGDDFNRPDFTIVSPILSFLRFQLSEATIIGKRTLSMAGSNLYRMPNNSHITNLYPVAGEGGCGNAEVGEITQVNPGEENFYINNSDLKSFQFFVQKGSNIDTYNVPPCIIAIDMEATFDVGEETDIDNSMAVVIADHVLGVSLGVKKQYYSEQVQEEMKKQNLINR